MRNASTAPQMGVFDHTYLSVSVCIAHAHGTWCEVEYLGVVESGTDGRGKVGVIMAQTELNE